MLGGTPTRLAENRKHIDHPSDCRWSVGCNPNSERQMSRPKREPEVDTAYQFLIVLPKTDPLVWRRIQVPDRYSFWDLHVAIQDAMGWKDYHLHEFTVPDGRTGRSKRIGIPDEEMPDERPCSAGWRVPIARYFSYGTDPVRYRYDFGDDWQHIVEFEEIVPAERRAYPRCVAGAGACPPEDVGGVDGYARFLRTIGDPGDPERDALLQWAGGVFDPYAFSPEAIRFDDPAERWRAAFEDDPA